MSEKVKAISNKVYQMGSQHIAGQHSLTGGELIAVGLAALCIFMPNVIKGVPIVGKYAGATAAFVILVLALIIW